MLSKNKIKLIRSLENKKHRIDTGLFVAEGNKLVADILPFFDCELLVAKPAWIAEQDNLKAGELIIAGETDISKASLLKNPQDVIAVFSQAKRCLNKESLKNGLTLFLDGIQDPGNLGTIVRLANWFGIRNLICSHDTADVYNPKTVQASMGSIAFVDLFYEFLPGLLDDLKEIPVYGAFLDGKILYEEKLHTTGIIVMGNEGNGIRPEVEPYIHHRLYIPNFPQGSKSTESLNVAVATAIVCSEFRRQEVYAG
jgi:TrmH family RNA methyltransferase